AVSVFVTPLITPGPSDLKEMVPIVPAVAAILPLTLIAPRLPGTAVTLNVIPFPAEEAFMLQSPDCSIHTLPFVCADKNDARVHKLFTELKDPMLPEPAPGRAPASEESWIVVA